MNNFIMNIKEHIEPEYLLVLLLPIATMISPWVAIVILGSLAIYYMLRYDEKTMLFFIVYLFFQNILLLVFAKTFTKESTQIFALIKEFMLYGCVFLSVIKARKLKEYDIIVAVFIVYLLIPFFLSDAGALAKLVSVRQVFLPFICFLFGYHLITTDKWQEEDLINVICWGSILLGICGLAELAIGSRFWQMLPMRTYLSNRGTAFKMYHGMPVSFSTWDFQPIIGGPIRRLVSLLVDPLATGHFLFLGFVLNDTKTTVKNEKIRILRGAFLFICSMLVFSKGIVLAYCIYLAVKLVCKLEYEKIIKALAGCIILAGVVLAPVAYVSLHFFPKYSIAIHLRGFLKGVSNGSLFGFGMGKAGGMTGYLSNTKMITIESYFGVLVAQLGYCGVLLFAAFWIWIFWKLLKYGKLKQRSIYISVAAILLAVLFEALFSETSITLIGTGLYFMLAGLLVQKMSLNLEE